MSDVLLKLNVMFFFPFMYLLFKHRATAAQWIFVMYMRKLINIIGCCRDVHLNTFFVHDLFFNNNKKYFMNSIVAYQ